MRTSLALLRNLPLRWIQPRPTAAVAPLPVKPPFSEQLMSELITLQSLSTHDEPKFSSASGLIQLLDASIAAQRIALDMFAKISHRDDAVLDYRALDEHLENNVEILDACNYFLEKIEMIKKYANTLTLVARLVDHGGAKPNNEISLNRALGHLESCQDIQRKCRVLGKQGSCPRKQLRQKLVHEYESELSEIMCVSEALALMGCRFLELGLSFDSTKQLSMKTKSHDHEPTSSSWLGLLQEISKQAERSEKLKKRSGNLLMMSELKHTVSAATDLKEVIRSKREKELGSCRVQGLKRSLRELEDVVNVIEERISDLYKSLIDVRMALLGMISKA